MRCTDPTCPCNDGDPCHYEDHGDTEAMLNAAHENVLMAVDGCLSDRQVSTAASIRDYTTPPLSLVVVVALLKSLVRDGYIEHRADVLPHYALTDRGRRYADRVIATAAGS